MRLVLSIGSLGGCLGLCLTALGCAGGGVGVVSGQLFSDPCTQSRSLGAVGAPVPFDLHPSFFVADPVFDLQVLHPVNRVSIHIQSSSSAFEDADVLMIDVANVRTVAEALGQALSIGPASVVRASLRLNDTCPYQPTEMELDGTLAFGTFGKAGAGPVAEDFRIDFDDPLVAAFHFDVVDRRALTLSATGLVPGVTVGGHLDGSFSLRVDPGRGSQTFR